MLFRVIQDCNRTTLGTARAASILTPGMFMPHASFLTKYGMTISHQPNDAP
jgi:hypothetical protein